MNDVTPGGLSSVEEDAFCSSVAAGVAATLRLSRHQVDFVPGGPALVVTFEPAAETKGDTDLSRPAWSQSFLQRRGHAVLGVKRTSTDWYRQPDLHRLFRRLERAGWFKTFERVMFYGPSMGGYAALAFAAVAPGCTVLAMHPQSTLAADRVWFDQRFATRRAQAWAGDFVDGADGAAAAARVYVCYDPWQTKDRLHAARLPAHNRVDLRLPCVGHATTRALQALGLLGTVVDRALDGTLTADSFRELARERARLPDYHVRLAERGLYLPRQLRLVEHALAMEPGHSRALRLRDRLSQPVQGPAVPAVRRWPAGLVTIPRVPLVYVNLPKCASTTIQNHLYFMGTGRTAENPYAIDDERELRRSRESAEDAHRLIGRQIDDGALVFTFVRDPGHRAYACFHEKIMRDRPRSFNRIRSYLVEQWGLRPPGPEDGTPLELQQENFLIFLRFVEANLAGDTEIRQDANWRPQGPVLAEMRQHVKIQVVGRVEHFASDMAYILHRAGVRRLPDLRQLPVRHGIAPYGFDEVVTPAHQAILDRIYASDYKHLRYGHSAE